MSITDGPDDEGSLGATRGVPGEQPGPQELFKANRDAIARSTEHPVTIRNAKNHRYGFAEDEGAGIAGLGGKRNGSNKKPFRWMFKKQPNCPDVVHPNAQANGDDKCWTIVNYDTNRRIFAGPGTALQEGVGAVKDNVAVTPDHVWKIDRKGGTKRFVNVASGRSLSMPNRETPALSVGATPGAVGEKTGADEEFAVEPDEDDGKKPIKFSEEEPVTIANPKTGRAIFAEPDDDPNAGVGGKKAGPRGPEKCQSTGDPHFISFAGKKFDNHNLGWQVLYKKGALMLEMEHALLRMSGTRQIMINKGYRVTYNGHVVDEGSAGKVPAANGKISLDKTLITLGARSFGSWFTSGKVLQPWRYDVFITAANSAGAVGLCAGIKVDKTPVVDQAPRDFGGNKVSKPAAKAACRKLHQGTDQFDACVNDALILDDPALLPEIVEGSKQAEEQEKGHNKAAVTVVEGKDPLPPKCQCTGDPHCISFHGRKFDNHYLGWQVLYMKGGLIVEQEHALYQMKGNKAIMISKGYRITHNG